MYVFFPFSVNWKEEKDKEKKKQWSERHFCPEFLFFPVGDLCAISVRCYGRFSHRLNTEASTVSTASGHDGLACTFPHPEDRVGVWYSYTPAFSRGFALCVQAA